MFHWQATIMGPSDSPYSGGVFLVTFGILQVKMIFTVVGLHTQIPKMLTFYCRLDELLGLASDSESDPSFITIISTWIYFTAPMEPNRVTKLHVVTIRFFENLVWRC